MRYRLSWVVLASTLLASVASAQDPDPIRIEGTVDVDDPATHFFEAFEVPEGIVEIEVRHDDLSAANILDWGLDDPNGFRGWGGGNTEPAVVGLDAASRSYVPGAIPAGTWEVVIGKARIEELPARYEIEIFLRTEATLPAQSRTPYEDPGVLDETARWYAGDFHVHTRESGDAIPTIPDTIAFADGVGLDFVVLTDHNTNSNLTLYGDTQADYPNLLMMPGVEWTTYAGHANAFGATEWVDHKTGVRGVTLEGAIQEFHDQGALFSINHPTVPGGNFCIGCPWDFDADPTTVDGVEIQSAVWDAITYWEETVEAGSRAAAIGGSDDHRGGDASGELVTPIGTPTTMVFAENLSVDAILDGIRAGRTVVKVNGPDDPMLETELSGERMGDTVFANSATLSAVVTGGEGETLLVIRNGDVIDRVSITSDPFTHETSVTAPAEGEDRYRHQVDSGTTPMTVGSYVWLQAGGSSGGSGDSGCSCRVVGPTGRDTLVVAFIVLGLATWLRRRRRASRGTTHSKNQRAD